MLRVVAVVAFLAVPLVEIYALIQVGQVIGPWWTILLLVADSLLGAWLLRRELRGTWARLRAATGSGQLPDRELADAALVIIGGTLLLTPGFVTDIAGFFFLLPMTRPIARRALLSFVGRRLRVEAGRFTAARFARTFGGPSGGSGQPGGARPPSSGAGGPRGPGAPRGGPVIQGEVVDERSDPPG